MIEKKISAPLATVHQLLTDAHWVEQRCLALGELAAKVKHKKTAAGLQQTMQRRIKRSMPALVAKVLPAEADMTLTQAWHNDDDGYCGHIDIVIPGQPVELGGDFELRPAGKGCVYRIEHTARCRIPLVGGAVEKFALSELDNGCIAELDYLVAWLKKHPA
jgi:hypothetical protein